MQNLQYNTFYKKMDSDNVVSEVFKVYKKHFTILLLISFITNLAVFAPSYLLSLHSIDIQSFEAGEIENDFFVSLALIIVVALVAFTLSAVIICNFVYQSGYGKPNFKAVFFDSVSSHYLRFLVALIIGSIILMLGSVAGVFVFVVGFLVAMFYLGTVLTPVGPVTIIEKKNPIEAISRSFSLTHKDFWGALGALLLLVVFYIVVAIIASIIMLSTFAFDVLGDLTKGVDFYEIIESVMANQQKITLTSSIVNFGVSVFTMPFFPIFSVILYYKLKFSEDHMEPDFERRTF